MVSHRRQRGIADSLRSAGDVARGDVFVFYPADLQYLPEDIPGLVAPILDGRADIVTGTKQGKLREGVRLQRVQRPLPLALRRPGHRPQFGQGVSSRSDARSAAAARLASLHGRDRRGRRLPPDVPAGPLYPRRAGVSKFNWKRIPVGLFDLISVWFQLRFGRKPMLFFGVGGAILFVIGFLAGIVALVLRFGYGIGLRPLLNLVEMMVISGIVLFGFGFLGEIIAGMREENREIARGLARLEKPDVRD